MKALTDKIRQKLQILASECNPNSEYSKGIQQAIATIEWEENQADFEEVARVMMKHLGNVKKYHPHHTVIISNSSAELVEGQKVLGKVMDYVPD